MKDQEQSRSYLFILTSDIWTKRDRLVMCAASILCIHFSNDIDRSEAPEIGQVLH